MSWWIRGETAAIPPAVRLGLIAIGLVMLALLGTAAGLDPDARGYGTHQQLGLPPCTFQSLAGMRCPSCGMTTAWAQLLRGRLLEAAAANVGGLVLGLGAATLGPWALVSGIRGQWLAGRPSEGLTAAVVASAVVVTLMDWGFRIFLTG